MLFRSDGTITYKGPFGIEVRQEDLPQTISMPQTDTFYLDGKRWEWKVAATLKEDSKNGYSSIKMLAYNLFGKKIR